VVFKEIASSLDWLSLAYVVAVMLSRSWL